MDIPATSDNIPGTLVLRDANGGFSTLGELRVKQTLNDGTGGTLVCEAAAPATGVVRIYHAGSANGRIRVGSVDCIYLRNDSRVGINTEPDGVAQLDVSSTTRGFLPPRMTEAERDAITSPPAGLMLYNSTTNKLQVRTDTAWVDLH